MLLLTVLLLALLWWCSVGDRLLTGICGRGAVVRWVLFSIGGPLPGSVRVLARLQPLLRTIDLPYLLGCALKARVVDGNSVVLVQRWLVGALIIGLRGHRRWGELTPAPRRAGHPTTATWSSRPSRVGSGCLHCRETRTGHRIVINDSRPTSSERNQGHERQHFPQTSRHTPSISISRQEAPFIEMVHIPVCSCCSSEIRDTDCK